MSHFEAVDNALEQHTKIAQQSNPFLAPVAGETSNAPAPAPASAPAPAPGPSAPKTNGIHNLVNKAAASLPAGHPPSEFSNGGMAPGGKVRLTNYVSAPCQLITDSFTSLLADRMPTLGDTSDSLPSPMLPCLQRATVTSATFTLDFWSSLRLLFFCD